MSDIGTQPRGTLRLCRWAFHYASRRRLALLGVLLAMFLKVGVGVLTPWPMKVIVDYGLQRRPVPPALAGALAWLPGADSREVLISWSVAATVLLFLAGWLTGVISSFADLAFGQRIVYDLGADLFQHLQRLSSRFHARQSAGDVIRRVTTDSGAVATIIKDALLPVAGSVVSLTAMFTIMFRIDWMLTLLALSVLPYMVIVFRRYSQPMMRIGHAQQQQEGRLYGLVEETLSAIPVVQAFTREADNDARLRQSAAAVLSATLATTNVQLRFKILMGLATAVGTASIVWLGARRVLEGTISVGDLWVFLSYLGMLYAPLQAFMYSSSTVQGAAGSAWRVLDVLETAPEVQDGSDATVLPPLRGHVRLEGVTFGYEPGRPVLQDVSLQVAPGETVAIVGPTGAGKSTVVGLLSRSFDPWQGRVTIDGNDLRDARLVSVRQNVAVVPQEPFLFPRSVAENIAYGRPDATPAEIEGAARAANAHEFIEQLPERYQTVVGERGCTLSGGQRQRISIARALLKDAPVLVLDEPTSALDTTTEGSLLEALRRSTAGRATLVIAHRLSTVRDADRIAVLDEGRVVEQGPHDELLRRGGLYASLYAAQFAADVAVAPCVPGAPEGERR